MADNRPYRSIILCVTVVVSLVSGGRADDLERVRYLDAVEKQIVREINLARTDPARYAGFIREWTRYYDGKVRVLPDRARVRTKEGLRAVREAIRFLERSKPVPGLRPSSGMSKGAHDHVRDLGPIGATGHRGLDGSRPADRVDRYGKWKGRVGENITYGGDVARELIIRLIIDDGVRDRGHRKNIFAESYRVVGVAFGYHDQYETMCVITFADDYLE